MLVPALFFGTFDFLALSSFNKMVKGVMQFPKLYARQKTIEHAKSRKDLETWYKDTDSMSPDNLFINNMRQPSNIDGEALNNLFREGQQEADPDTKTNLNIPAVNIAPLLNPNPKVDALVQQFRLTEKFQEIQIKSWIN